MNNIYFLIRREPLGEIYKIYSLLNGTYNFNNTNVYYSSAAINQLIAEGKWILQLNE